MTHIDGRERGLPCEFSQLIIALILEVGVTFCVCVRPALKHDRHVVRHDEPGRGKDDAALAEGDGAVVPANQLCEPREDALPQFITELDGLDIHFIHVRSKQTNALPLIVTHGAMMRKSCEWRF